MWICKDCGKFVEFGQRCDCKQKKIITEQEKHLRRYIESIKKEREDKYEGENY